MQDISEQGIIQHKYKCCISDTLVVKSLAVARRLDDERGTEPKILADLIVRKAERRILL